ncbi:MAG: hypothetical protein QOC63_3207 [Mycobacterium sp.]|nr:hypothetical protein [Mycobacterium sp.]
MTQTEQVRVTDGMIVEWDVPIDMDDGVQLRAHRVLSVPTFSSRTHVTPGP